MKAECIDVRFAETLILRLRKVRQPDINGENLFTITTPLSKQTEQRPESVNTAVRKKPLPQRVPELSG